MKPRILQLLVFVLVLWTWGFAEALEPLKLYDNFDQALINPDKWRGDQFQTGGYYQELVAKSPRRSTTFDSSIARMATPSATAGIPSTSFD